LAHPSPTIYYLITCSRHENDVVGVMVSELTSSVIDRGLELRSDQKKD